MANPMADDASLELSADTLLGGRVTLLQPVKGYRAAIDPVFLAAAVPAKAEETVLDVGVGVGAAALCLAARVAEARVAGIELRRELVRLAVRNAEANGLARRVDFMVGDLVKAPRRLAPGSFHHVMANPPYRARGTGNLPPDPGRAAATVEGKAELNDWLAFCIRMMRDGGTVTLIHHYDRRDEVVSGLRRGAGGIVVCPLWPKQAGEGAKRVIIGARRGSPELLTILPGLILHGEEGTYTEEAESMLRHGQPLALMCDGRP